MPLAFDLDLTAAAPIAAKPKSRPLLTPRQVEIVVALASGSTNEQVSQKCNITSQSTKNHLTAIYQKLHVQNGTGAVVKCLKQKVFCLDDVKLTRKKGKRGRKSSGPGPGPAPKPKPKPKPPRVAQMM